MLGLGAVSVMFAKRRSPVTDGAYLRASWFLSSVAVLATALDRPVTATVGDLLRWGVPPQWLSGLSEPPILAVRSQVVAAWCAGAAALLLVGGCIVIAFVDRWDHQGAARRAEMMAHARLMATSWLMVVLAAQLGSLRKLGVDVQAAAGGCVPSGRSVLVAAGVVAVLLVVAVTTLLRSRVLGLAGRALWKLARAPMLELGRFLAALMTATSMVVIGFVLWPASYVIKGGTWMLSPTPEAIQRARMAAAEAARSDWRRGIWVVRRSTEADSR